VVIVGVIQMTVGLFLKFLNAIHFRQPFDILFEFIPQILFLHSIFGYLCFMIFYKWNTDYFYQDMLNAQFAIANPGVNLTCAQMGTQQAPILLNEIIFMFLPRSTVTCPLYPAQSEIQIFLKVIALACVPVMMFAKPIALLIQHKSKAKGYESLPPVNTSNGDSDTDNDNALLSSHPSSKDGHGGAHGEHGEFDFGELMIHQSLETVEFVLGSVSHTASYLRLWALSLAHSELATVFWDKTMAAAFEYGAGTNNVFLTGLLGFVAFSSWITFTIGIILFMETLSAFLHALRLHWVEFQSKFYKGDGHLFKPFAYSRILSGDAD